MAKVTLRTIAEKLGISTVAVHKALNDQKGVSEELRKKVKENAKRVGYSHKNLKNDLTYKKYIFFILQDLFLTHSEQFYSTIFYL